MIFVWIVCGPRYAVIRAGERKAASTFAGFVVASDGEILKTELQMWQSRHGLNELFSLPPSNPSLNHFLAVSSIARIEWLNSCDLFQRGEPEPVILSHIV